MYFFTIDCQFFLHLVFIRCVRQPIFPIWTFSDQRIMTTRVFSLLTRISIICIRTRTTRKTKQFTLAVSEDASLFLRLLQADERREMSKILILPTPSAELATYLRYNTVVGYFSIPLRWNCVLQYFL